MNIKEIRKAATLAARFIALSKEIESIEHKEYSYVQSGKASGALRRASLDLTRQLATMRRPG